MYIDALSYGARPVLGSFRLQAALQSLTRLVPVMSPENRDVRCVLSNVMMLSARVPQVTSPYVLHFGHIPHLLPSSPGCIVEPLLYSSSWFHPFFPSELPEVLLVIRLILHLHLELSFTRCSLVAAHRTGGVRPRLHYGRGRNLAGAPAPQGYS